MPSFSRSAARVVRGRLSPSTCSAGSVQPYQSHADACGSTFALADVPDCSSPSSAHSWVLDAERRHRRRPREGGCYVAENLRLGFAVAVPVGVATYRPLSTIAAKPVDESDKGGADGADGGKHNDDESEYYGSKSDNDDGDEEDEEEPSDSIYKILTGRPQADPAEHVEAHRKHVFPKTMEGWNTLFRDVWATYYNTFEGWETEEERIEREREERRAKGLPVDEDEDEDDTETVYQIEYDEDALRQKQKEITDNFGRNLNIAHSTGQDLLEQAKEKTGIRTKEDLKIWAGEQMKLATTCLSEFMGGYREGRDEEVDRMLNEYFKDLDETNNEGNSGGNAGAGADADTAKGLGDTSAKEIQMTSDSGDDVDVDAPPPEKKSGRRRRKRRI